MLFNSLIFLLFAMVFFSLWPWFAPHKEMRWAAITVASLIFYGWWNWRYVFLLIGTGLVDFLAARAMENYPRRKKMWLILSIGTNLLTLFIFKYFHFFLSSLQHLAGRTSPTALAMGFILPVGISFYTFQSMSYTIDVYRGELKATRSIFHFLAALSMFPHLVAGPIMRARVLLPQLEEWHAPDEQKRWEGLRLIAIGYFNKTVLADNLAPAVNTAFENHSHIASAPYWWIITTMFAMQIYFDFSGYSNVARGLAKWMGYEFTLNFNDPYLATSFGDFWSRWHISLSTWFRDYVYIPLELGGSSIEGWKSTRNLWITMLLSGLWHGANWTYILWGGLHALYLQVERWTDWPRKLAVSIAGRLAVSFYCSLKFGSPGFSFGPRLLNKRFASSER